MNTQWGGQYRGRRCADCGVCSVWPEAGDKEMLSAGDVDERAKPQRKDCVDEKEIDGETVLYAQGIDGGTYRLRFEVGNDLSEITVHVAAKE